MIEYRGGVMVSCRESISGYIGQKLVGLSQLERYSALGPVVAVWNDALEAPPGCSSIELDSVIPDDFTRLLLIEALTEVHALHQVEVVATKHHRRNTMLAQQLRQIIIFLELGEQALEQIHRPIRAEATSPPNTSLERTRDG